MLRPILSERDALIGEEEEQNLHVGLPNGPRALGLQKSARQITLLAPTLVFIARLTKIAVATVECSSFIVASLAASVIVSRDCFLAT